MGRHFQLGGALQRAEIYLWNSVQLAMRVGLPTDSVRQFHAWMRSYTGDPELFWNRVRNYLKAYFSAITLLFGDVCDSLVDRARLENDPDILVLMLSYRIRSTDDVTSEERRLLREAYEHLPKCTSLLSRIHILRAHCQIEKLQGCLDTSEIQEEIIRVSREFGDEEELAESLIGYAISKTKRALYRESQALFDDVEQLLDSKPMSKRLEMDYLLGRATLEGDLGSRQKSVDLYLKSLEYLRLFGADRQLCVVQWNIANQYQLLGRYDEALAMLREAETLSAYMPFYDMRAVVAMSLAELQAKMGELDNARALFDRAKDVFDHPANEHHRIAAYFDVFHATFLRRQGYLDEGEAHLPEPTEDHYLNAYVWSERGFLRLARGEDAQQAIDACAVSIESAGFPPDSEPGRLLGALQRAASSTEALWAGECIGDIPPALYAALVARRA